MNYCEDTLFIGISIVGTTDMAFLTITNYDEEKGYLGDLKLDRYALDQEIYLADDIYSFKPRIFRVIDDDGKKHQVKAVEITNSGKLESIINRLISKDNEETKKMEGSN